MRYESGQNPLYLGVDPQINSTAFNIVRFLFLFFFNYKEIK